jgi:hypothetical protein
MQAYELGGLYCLFYTRRFIEQCLRSNGLSYYSSSSSSSIKHKHWYHGKEEVKKIQKTVTLRAMILGN